MKKFRFPLDRVMEWRRTQARIEEAKLEHLYAELRMLDTRASALNQERAASETALLAASSSFGEELAALDTFQRFTVAEQGRLTAKRTECAQKIAAQTQTVVAKRRDVRLLEKLKEQRLETWRADFGREIDAQAEEAFLAKWNRGR